MSSQIQQENISLKKQVTILRKQLALNKQQLAEQNIVHSAKQKSFRNGIIPEKTNHETNHLASNHTLSATFDALESNHKYEMIQSLQTNHPKHNALLSKYEQMRQIGVNIDIIILQMRKDNITENIITSFSNEINSNKYIKYNRMKSNGAPLKSILNTMEFDGLSQTEIDIFCNDIKPSEFINGLPEKLELKKPNHKMKHIHWQPIKLQNISDSLWNNLNHKWNEFDTNKIENKFKIKLNCIKLDKTHLINNVCIPFNIDKQIKFIPPNRSKQVSDALKLFNFTNQELRNIILNMNSNKLNIKLIKILLEIIPTSCEQLMSDRMSQLQNVKSFGITERFFYSICDIIELKQRINNWVFKLEFELRFKELMEQITTIQTAKVVIICCNEFKQILNIILNLGNYMNYAKSNRNAYGFCIADLNLLQEIKTSDNSMTFLMYLCSFLQKKHPNVLNVIERFKLIHEAAVINSDIIKQRYKELLQEINELNTLLIRYKNEHYQIPNSNDLFYPKMINFKEIINTKMNELNNKMNELNKCEIELIKYFGLENNNQNINIQKIFQFISTFIFELQYSNINLKQFEQIKKKIKSNKKRTHKKSQRRAISENLTRNNMNKYVPKKSKLKLKYATSFDGAGTKIKPNNISQIMDNRMNTFDENKSIDSPLPGVPKIRVKPKLLVSQSVDENSVSFGNFKNKSIIHSYDYSGNYGNKIDENRVDITPLEPSAIVHSYTEPSSPRTSNHNVEPSFCLYTSNSELDQQKFGAVLDSPLPNKFNKKINGKSNQSIVNEFQSINNKFQNI